MTVELTNTSINAQVLSVWFDQMIQEKIRENEAGIHASSNEEDIEIRENNIRRLQKEWQDFRAALVGNGGMYTLRAELAN